MKYLLDKEIEYEDFKSDKEIKKDIKVMQQTENDLKDKIDSLQEISDETSEIRWQPISS